MDSNVIFEELTDSEESDAWNVVTQTFGFSRAAPCSGHPQEIREPRSCDLVFPSYLASRLPEDLERRKRVLSPYNELLARVLQRALRTSEWLLVLDWQHACYRVRLHEVPASAWQDHEPLHVMPAYDPRFHVSTDFSNGCFSGVEERLYLLGDAMRDAARVEGLHGHMPLVHRPRW